jgi:hypothetical protein
MAFSFPFPISEGQTISAALLNEIIFAIQDGSIFTSVSFVSDLVTTLDTRVDDHETRIVDLETRLGVGFQRQQFTLTTGQDTIPLSEVPILDSEVIFYNDKPLYRDELPAGFQGEYTLSGSTLTLDSLFALTVVDGDRLAIAYSYEVP